MKLSNNTILITGGASGIGMALARAFYNLGNNIIVCGSNAIKLDELKQQLPNAVTYQCDLSDETSLQGFTETLLQNHSDLNVLVNNAGIQHRYGFADEQSHWEWIKQEVAINLVAPLQLTDQLLPLLRKQEAATIINVTSALAITPKKNAAVYCATKAALSHFSKALRYQLEDSSVAVFDLVPPLVDTNMTKGSAQNKISPEVLVEEAISAIGANRYFILIGKAKLLYWLHRFFPSLAGRILKET